jgi:hypothetical protein
MTLVHLIVQRPSVHACETHGMQLVHFVRRKREQSTECPLQQCSWSGHSVDCCTVHARTTSGTASSNKAWLTVAIYTLTGLPKNKLALASSVEP